MEQNFLIGKFLDNNLDENNRVIPQLYPPESVELINENEFDYYLSFSSNDKNGNFVNRYKIYNNVDSTDILILDKPCSPGDQKVSVFDLGDSSVYNLKIALSGNNFIDSKLSTDTIIFKVFNVNYNFSNIGVQKLNDSNNIYKVIENSLITVKLVAENNKYLPDTLTVLENGEPKDFIYDSYTGVLTINDIRGNIEISANAYDQPKLTQPNIYLIDNHSLKVDFDNNSSKILLFVNDNDIPLKIYDNIVENAVYDLHDLDLPYDSNTYTIKVRTSADNFQDSSFSNSIDYNNIPNLFIENPENIIVSNLNNSASELTLNANNIDSEASFSVTVSLDGLTESKTLSYSQLSGITDGYYTLTAKVKTIDNIEYNSNTEKCYIGAVEIFGVSGEYKKSNLTRTDNAVGLNYSIDSGSGLITSDFDSKFPWSDISDYTDEPSGNIFVKIPKYYTSYEFLEDGSKTTRISKYKINSNYKLNPAFIDNEGNELDFIYVAKYLSSKSESNSLESKTNTEPVLYNYVDEMRDACSTSYYLMDYNVLKAVQDLCMIEFATTNTSSILSGNSYIYNGLKINGLTDNIGSANSSGYDKSSNCMKYRGIENLWRNGNTFIDGLRIITFKSGYSDKIYSIKYCDNYLQYSNENSYTEYLLSKDEMESISGSYPINYMINPDPENLFLQFPFQQKNNYSWYYDGSVSLTAPSSYNIKYELIYAMNEFFGYATLFSYDLKKSTSYRVTSRLIKK